MSTEAAVLDNPVDERSAYITTPSSGAEDLKYFGLSMQAWIIGCIVVLIVIVLIFILMKSSGSESFITKPTRSDSGVVDSSFNIHNEVKEINKAQGL